MLRVEKGMCMINGDMFELPADLIVAIKAVRDVFAENVGEKGADKVIYLCGRAAYLDEDEFEAGLEELRKELLGE